jgi:hypothetical protein
MLTASACSGQCGTSAHTPVATTPMSAATDFTSNQATVVIGVQCG